MLTVIMGLSELPMAVLKYAPYSTPGGCSSMVERQLPKLHTRVRSPSPAPFPAPFSRQISLQNRPFGILTVRCMRVYGSLTGETPLAQAIWADVSCQNWLASLVYFTVALFAIEGGGAKNRLVIDMRYYVAVAKTVNIHHVTSLMN